MQDKQPDRVDMFDIESLQERVMSEREVVFLSGVRTGIGDYGAGLKDMDGVVATGNRFIGNRAGLYLDNSPWSHDGHQTFETLLFSPCSQ